MDGSKFRPSSDRELPHAMQCDTGRKVHAMNSDRQSLVRGPRSGSARRDTW
jgi:hypothetical protein